MQAEKSPEPAAFRAEVAGLKDMDIYREPGVKVLLEKRIAATQ